MNAPDIPFNAPLDREHVREAISRLDLRPEHRVLDVGCGTGEMLALVLEEFDCRVVGVDPDEAAMSKARERLRAAGDRAELIPTPVAEAGLADDWFDAALCVGSTHAFGGVGSAYVETLQALTRLVRPGGRMLIGDGYWKKDPDEEYLRASGLVRHELRSHEANLYAAEEMGLEHIHSSQSSRDEWDRFEASFLEAAEKHLSENPDSTSARERADHWRRWNDAYCRFGRETFGFALYIFGRS